MWTRRKCKAQKILIFICTRPYIPPIEVYIHVTKVRMCVFTSICGCLYRVFIQPFIRCHRYRYARLFVSCDGWLVVVWYVVTISSYQVYGWKYQVYGRTLVGARCFVHGARPTQEEYVRGISTSIVLVSRELTRVERESVSVSIPSCPHTYPPPLSSPTTK